MTTIRTVATLVAGLVTLPSPVHGQANDGRPQRLLEARVDSLGFRTVILRFPEKHTTIVVLANKNDLPVGAVVQEIAAIYLEGRR